MRNKSMHLSGTVWVLVMTMMYFSCNQPTRPIFVYPPEIENEKLVQHTGIVSVGSEYSMYIAVTGTEPFSYQWYKNNQELTQDTTDTLFFSTLLLADSGYYYCIVTNEAGSDTSIIDTLAYGIILAVPTNVTYKSVRLSWKQYADADFGAYKIYYDTAPAVSLNSTLAKTITDIFTTTATVDSLAENTHYYFKMYAYTTSLSYTGSNVVDTTTTILAPPIITIATPAILSDSGFIREATPSIVGSNITAAGIQSMTATINGGAVTVTLANNDWNLSLAGVAQKQQWNSIVLTSVDSESKTGDTTVYIYYMPTLSVPTAPEITGNTNRSISLSWERITYCTNYLLYRSATGTTGDYTLLYDGTDTLFTDSLCAVGMPYWYKIRAYYVASVSFETGDTTEYSAVTDSSTANWFQKYFAGKEQAAAKKVLQTSDSGFIVAGVTFTDSGENDIYVVRTDRSGDTLWTGIYGGANNEQCFDMVESGDGGYVLVGNSTSFNATLNEDVYIIKIDSYGGFVWEKYFGSDNNDRANAIVRKDDGNYAIAGQIYDISDSSYDVLIAELNSNGDTLWTEMFGDTGYQIGTDIQIYNDELVILGQNGIYYNGGADALIIRRYSDGDINPFTVNLSSSATGNDAGIALLVDTDGFVIAGQCDASWVPGTGKACLAKVNFFNGQVFKTIFDGPSGASALDVKKTRDGNGYIVAGIVNMPYMPPSTADMYLVKTNLSGQIDANGFETSIGGPLGNGGNSVVATFDGGYTVAGYSYTTDNKSMLYLVKTDSSGHVE